MGHYASEMNGESDECSDYLKERLEKMSKWVVTPKFEVQQFGKFLGENANERHDFDMHLWLTKTYDTREEAEKAAMKQCENFMLTAKKNFLYFKKLLVTKRPWEKK